MKKWLTSIVVLILLITSSNMNNIQAQDARFTQAYSSPLRLNPAMTGVFDGQFRAMINYRDQWSSVLGATPYTTYAVGMDMKFFALKKDFLSAGFSVLGDRAGASRFNQTQAHLSLSYMKQVAGGRGRHDVQYLIAGAQVGAGQHGINWQSLQFSTQFDGEGHDPDILSGENTDAQKSKMYADLNAGLMWYGVFRDRLSLYGGAAIHHINSPDVSFLDNDAERLYTKFIIHGGGEIPVGKYSSLLPAAIFMQQGPHMEIDAGATYRYSNKDWGEVALRAGLWTRVVGKADKGVGTDAISAIAALEIEQWQIGLSYDVNTSTLERASNNRGAFEVSLIYIHKPKRRGGVYCPNF